MLLGLLVLLSVVLMVWLGFRRLWRQNLPLWREYQASGRPVSKLVRDALFLWSPLGVVIVLLAAAASLMASGAVSMAYRLTTLDEFCKVVALPGDVVLPCTGMDGVLPAGRVRPLGVAADLDRRLSADYRAARSRIVAMPERQLGDAMLDREGFMHSLSPVSLLALQPAPEEDPELLRLKRELRSLMDTPVKPADGVLDMVRYLTERDARITRMRRLTAVVLARREQANRQAYEGLTPMQLHPLRFGHRVAHVLAGVPMRLDANADRAAVLRMLAENESEVSDRLRAEFATPVEMAALSVTLGLARHCTLASPDPQLRLHESDFEGEDGGGIIESNGGAFACFAIPASATPIRLQALGLRESVHRSIDRWHERSAQSAFKRIGRISRRVQAGGGDAALVARELGGVVPARIHLGRQQCRWSHPVRCLMNSARESIEEGYARSRSRLEGQLQSGANGVAGSAASGADREIGTALLTLDARLDSMHQHARQVADDLFWYHDLLQLLGWMLLAVIAFKSFLYVLALELFHSDEQMTLRFDGADPVEGSYRSGLQLAIDRGFRTPLVTRKQLSNADNHLVLAPWPWASPVVRILRRRYFFFTRVSLLEDGDRRALAGDLARGMVASASGGQSIVEWTLREGEQVIFRYKDFYGASENVSLHSEFSLRLSTLLFGRVIFHSARCRSGEGRLLLKANVEAIDQAQIRAVPPDRMIAWSRHAQFTVHSGRTPWKTLVNGFTLVRKERADGHHGLIVVSSEDTGASTGSLRYLKRIFSSIF